MFDLTPLLYVDTQEGVRQLAERLAASPIVGVDTESDSMYSYREKVCLIQFTDAHGDVILDPLAVDSLDPLEPVFSDPGICKIFHGADYDLVCMKRDFGFQTRNLFDTLVAAEFLGMERKGLADLIDRFFGFPIDKQYQRHDWSRRPLEPEHLDYARGDTHFLPALREILLRRLHKAGRFPHHAEECLLLESKEWPERPFDRDGWQRIRGSKELDTTAQRVLRQLYLYRDAQARKLDRPAFKVIGDQILLQVARKRPQDKGELDRLLSGKNALKRRHADGLVRAVRDGLADADPLPGPGSRRPQDDDDDEAAPARLRGRNAERVQEALKAWRNRLVNSSRLYSPYSLASNADLKAISRARPFDLAELRQVPGIRDWQVRDHGDAILAILDEVAPADGLDSTDDAPTGGRGGGGRRRRRGRGSSSS
ncbi:MAG: HRDC domain-containing protein [Alphaproteobacteria bacterium]|nr:HRDC domain-containing protein [Alphaproteobacteria bacterium]